jgi:hypothetical protein
LRTSNHRNFLTCVLAIGFILGLAAPLLAQTQAQREKVFKEWALTDEQRAAAVKKGRQLQENWSRGLWQVRGPLFFSSYKSVDDYLSGRKIPDGAPLTPEFQQKAAALREAGKRNRAAVDTTVFVQHLSTMGASFNQDPNWKPLQPVDVVCPLYGYPLELIEPNPFKWEFGTSKIFQLFQGDGGISRLIKFGVTMDGWKGFFRFPTNTVADGQGWAYAYWDGDVLTINVSHIAWYYENESGYVIEVGVPHSDKLTAVEKWRQTGPDTLELELTLTDATALTQPWTVKKTYDRIRGDEKYLELRDRQCH